MRTRKGVQTSVEPQQHIIDKCGPAGCVGHDPLDQLKNTAVTKVRRF
jgi:hypothetical protein